MEPSSTTTDERMNASTSHASTLDVKKQLLTTCCICNKAVGKKAKLLPCLHTLCCPCEITGMRDGKLTCQFCRFSCTANDIMDHFLLKYLNDANDVPRCSVCSDNPLAKFKCIECDDMLCVECSNAHQRVKITKEHQLKEIESASGIEDESKCVVHKHEFYRYFCTTCNVATCRDCQLQSHAGHMYIALADGIQSCFNDLQKITENNAVIEQSVSRLTSMIEQRTNDVNHMEEDGQKKTDTALRMIIAKLNDRRAEILQEIKNATQERRTFYMTMKSEVDSVAVLLRQINYFTEATRQCPNKLIVRQAFEAINRISCMVSQVRQKINQDTMMASQPIGLSLALQTTEVFSLLGQFGKVQTENGSTVQQSAAISQAFSGVGRTGRGARGSPNVRSQVPQSGQQRRSNVRQTSAASQPMAVAPGPPRHQHPQQQQLQRPNNQPSAAALQLQQKLYQQSLMHQNQNLQRLVAATPTQQQQQQVFAVQGQALANFWPANQMNPRYGAQMHAQVLEQQLAMQRQQQNFGQNQFRISQQQQQMANVTTSPNGAVRPQQGPPTVLIQQLASVDQRNPPNVLTTGQILVSNGSSGPQMFSSDTVTAGMPMLQEVPVIANVPPPLTRNRSFSSSSSSLEKTSSTGQPVDQTPMAHKSNTAKRSRKLSCNERQSNDDDCEIIMEARRNSVPLEIQNTNVQTLPTRSIIPAITKLEPLPVEEHGNDNSPVENTTLQIKTEIPLPVDQSSPPIPKCTIRLAKKSTTWTVSELKALMNQGESSTAHDSETVTSNDPIAAGQAAVGVDSTENQDQQKERQQQQDERQTPGASEVTTSSVPADRGDVVGADDDGAAATQPTDDNRWDDYCSVCQNGGDLICCEAPGCSRVFHCSDHIPQYETVPKESFICGLCANLDDLRSDLDNIPYEQRTPQKLTPYEHKICEKILLTLYCHADSIHFQNPVDALFVEYYERIKRPMDFSKIRRKLASKDRCYKTIPEFLQDLNQVFINCCLFNKENTEPGRAGIETGRLYKDLVKQYCPEYLDSVKCTVRFEKRRSNGRRRTNQIDSDDEQQQEQEICKRTKS